MQRNKTGLIAAILAFLSLFLSLYTSFSAAMNDGIYDTPAWFIKMYQIFHLNYPVPEQPEIRAVLFSFFDDNKRIFFFSVSIAFVLISGLLSFVAISRNEDSLYYSAALLTSINTVGSINNILFFLYCAGILFMYHKKCKPLF